MRYTKENSYAEHQKTAVLDVFFTSAFCLTNRNWRKNDYILFLLQYIGTPVICNTLLEQRQEL